MSQPVSDAAVELLGACRHSVRFSFGAPLGYPYAAARLSRNNPPPALFRRVQVASPPPGRQGAHWKTGLETDSGPFDPDTFTGPLSEVRAREDAISLDPPEPETIVLDWWFSVPQVRQTMTFPGSDGDLGFLSVPYWNPVPPSGETVTKRVEYFATHRLAWAKNAPESTWIAVSFDAFWPPERDSADLIARLSGCDALCPHSE
jgi:hypothetical protein